MPSALTSDDLEFLQSKSALQRAELFFTDPKFAGQNETLGELMSFGNLVLPSSSAEAIRCSEVKRILEDFAKREKPSCPLSIVVFGPPGSGKSHCVRELAKCAGGYAEPVTVNLSQLESPRELAKFFSQAQASEGPASDTLIKIFFFDEFDTQLNGEILGWLRWFLAPMQDSKFFHEDKTIEIGKCVFMFAGGTAHSLADFEDRAAINPEEFRRKKAPDFISRLRGYIDIEGINVSGEDRIIRRALVLRHQLQKRSPHLFHSDNGTIQIDVSVLQSFLETVHFVHGARSMEALLDMCQLSSSASFERNYLPERKLCKLHVSHGPFDGKRVGIATGTDETSAHKLFIETSKRLLQEGARLIYGGDFVPEGTLARLHDAAVALPSGFVEHPGSPIENYLGYPAFLRPESDQRAELSEKIRFHQFYTLSPEELQRFGITDQEWFPARSDIGPYNPNHHLAWAISLFRTRVRLIEDLDALIVVGGKDDKSWGRFSGIAEEVMLALALEKPVYVLGSLKGAAKDVGQLLGLGQVISSTESRLRHEDNEVFDLLLAKYASCFKLADHPDLPLDVPSLRQYFYQRSICTKRWRWNGLSTKENRDLFELDVEKKTAACIDLLVKGISRLDWSTFAPSAKSD